MNAKRRMVVFIVAAFTFALLAQGSAQAAPGWIFYAGFCDTTYQGAMLGVVWDTANCQIRLETLEGQPGVYRASGYAELNALGYAPGGEPVTPSVVYEANGGQVMLDLSVDEGATWQEAAIGVPVTFNLGGAVYWRLRLESSPGGAASPAISAVGLSGAPPVPLDQLIYFPYVGR